MTSSPRLFLLIVVMAAPSIPAAPAHALDMTGAWATDAAACAKMFVKKGKSIAFRPESEAHGSGFIVDGNSIKGKTANCTIKARKETGQFIHLLASCSTDIMLSEVQFSVKVVNSREWRASRSRMIAARLTPPPPPGRDAEGRAVTGPERSGPGQAAIDCSPERLSSGNGRP